MPNPYARFGETTTCRHEAWEIALDRVELDVIRAERALTGSEGTARVDAWHIPDDYGPIPGALRPRAENLVARQQQVIRGLAERMAVTAQHLAIVEVDA